MERWNDDSGFRPTFFTAIELAFCPRAAFGAGGEQHLLEDRQTGCSFFPNTNWLNVAKKTNRLNIAKKT
jgi:hypothetical protein